MIIISDEWVGGLMCIINKGIMKSMLMNIKLLITCLFIFYKEHV